MSFGICCDTGALIALENSEERMRQVLVEAERADRLVSVPSIVLVEWWRASPRQRRILERIAVVPLDERTAKAAGEALADRTGISAVDAAVMAVAALRGDVVYTSDVDDLTALHSHFPTVKVFSTSGR